MLYLTYKVRGLKLGRRFLLFSVYELLSTLNKHHNIIRHNICVTNHDFFYVNCGPHTDWDVVFLIKRMRMFKLNLL